MPPPAFPPSSRPAPIRAWRCVRHPEREAAARCPVCGQPFCRECVIEHEGRLLCAACLSKPNTPAPPPQSRRNFAPLRAALSLGTAALVLWFVFFYTATLLSRIPTEFHDATIWQEHSAPPRAKPTRSEKPAPAGKKTPRAPDR